MKKWKIPVTWEVYSSVSVEVPTLKEALQYVIDDPDDIPLPTENSYVEDSFHPTYGLDQIDIVRKFHNGDQADEIPSPVKMFHSMLQKSREEIDEMCDSGIFNEIIQGYVLYALDELGIDAKIRMSAIFDEVSASEARARARRAEMIDN